MSTEKKRAVGLVILTCIPGQNEAGEDTGEKKLAAVLQRRGEHNFADKDGRRESFRGMCQVSCHGKLDDTDMTFTQALYREMKEELGKSFLWALLDIYAGNLGQAIVELSHLNEKDKEVITYGLLVEAFLLKFVQFHCDSGGFRLLFEDEEILPVDFKAHKHAGVPDWQKTYMFADEIAAVQAAFKHFKQQV